MTATPTTRGRWRRVRAIAIIGSVFVLMVAVSAIVSQTAGFRHWLRGQIEARLNEALIARVTIGRLEGKLLGTFGVRDLRITSDAGRVVAIRFARVHYDLLTLLLARRLVVTAAVIDGMAIRVIEDERGWNVARLTRPTDSTGSSAFEVTLDGVEIRDAALTIVRPGEAWKFRDLALSGAIAFGGDETRIDLASARTVLPARALRIETLAGRLVVDASGVAVDDFALRTEASEVRARVRVPRDRTQAHTARFEVARLSALEMRRLARAWPLVVDLSGTLQASGPGSALALDANVTSAAGEAAMKGTLDLTRAPTGYDLAATVTHLDPAALLGRDEAASDLTGAVTLRGAGTTFEDTNGTATVALSDSTLAGTVLHALDLKLALAARRLEIEGSAATTASGRAQARGVLAVAEERYELEATFADFDVAPFVNRPALAGRSSGTVAVRGTGFTAATTRGELHLVLGRGTIGKVEVQSARIDARAAGGTLSIERAMLRSRLANADASGTLALTPEVTADPTRASGALRYEIVAADVSPLAALVGWVPLRGRATVTGNASGGIGALDAQARVEGRDLARAGIAVGTLTADVRGKRLGGAGARIDLTANAADLRAGGRHFEQLEAHAWWQRQAGATALAAIDLDLREDEAHRHGLEAEAALRPSESEIRVRALRADLGGETWVTSGEPTIVRRGDRVAIAKLELRSPTGAARLEGSAGASGAQDMTLTVEGLDLGVLAPTLRERVGGRLAGVTHLRGTAARPELDADVTVAEPTVGATRYQTLHASLRAAAGSATLVARVEQEASRQLALDVTLPLQFTLAPARFEPGDHLVGSIKAHALDLAILGPALPDVARLGGRLDADLTLAGTPATPEVRGVLGIAGGRGYVIPLGLTYDPVEVRASVDGRTVTLESLRIVSGKGSLEASGAAALSGDGTAMDVRVVLARFPLFANDYGDGAASGSITVRGTARAPEVAGRLTTDGLVLKIPESLPGSVRPLDPTITIVGPNAPAPVTEPARAARAAPTTPASQPLVGSLYERAVIDLALDVPRDAWIRRSDANVELRGTLAGRKLPGEMFRLTGEIEGVRGWYSFQGKKLTLSEGRVTFTGEGFDPNLRLIAVHETEGYTVRVIVAGTITKPALTLESDPPLEQADILSVLLFGRPTGRLSQTESAGLREQAISVVGSYAASELRQSVIDALGVDNLEFDTGTKGFADSKLSIGKYVAPDVFISLAHRFGKQNVGELRLEYRFAPQWSIETSSDTLGESGVDFFWKRRY